MSCLRLALLAAGALPATMSGSSSCSSSGEPGFAMSEEDVEQLEASETGVQEVSLLQHELKVSAVTVGATGSVGTAGNVGATINIDNSNITLYAREQIASVVMLEAASNRSRSDSGNLDAIKLLQYEL